MRVVERLWFDSCRTGAAFGREFLPIDKKMQTQTFDVFFLYNTVAWCQYCWIGISTVNNQPYPSAGRRFSYGSFSDIQFRTDYLDMISARYEH